VRYLTYKWFWTALDLLFPPSCGGCGKLGTRWCPECQRRVHKIVPPLCEICGQGMLEGGICIRCRTNPRRISAVRSWAVFGGPIRNAIHQLKYHRNVGLGEVFSSYLKEVLLISGWKIDIIIPVPLGNVRQKERGFNQAAMLAKPIALLMNLPYYPNALHRTRETQSQVDLTYEQRLLNVTGAFEAVPKFVKEQRVLIVDDVTTSGATLDSCADALLRAGALSVYGLTLARAG
jgi:competence protein ComFC